MSTTEENGATTCLETIAVDYMCDAANDPNMICDAHCVVALCSVAQRTRKNEEP